jgi:hypothetical protein
MGDQFLTSVSFVLVKGIDSLGAKGADLLGRPRHRMIRGEDPSESASLMGSSRSRATVYKNRMYLELGGGKHSGLSRAGLLSRGAL